MFPGCYSLWVQRSARILGLLPIAMPDPCLPPMHALRWRHHTGLAAARVDCVRPSGRRTDTGTRSQDGCWRSRSAGRADLGSGHARAALAADLPLPSTPPRVCLFPPPFAEPGGRSPGRTRRRLRVYSPHAVRNPPVAADPATEEQADFNTTRSEEAAV